MAVRQNVQFMVPSCFCKFSYMSFSSFARTVLPTTSPRWQILSSLKENALRFLSPYKWNILEVFTFAGVSYAFVTPSIMECPVFSLVQF